MMTKVFFLVLLIISISHSAYADKLAITFDDLPGVQSESYKQQQEINHHILKSLTAYQAPTIGFVNEGEPYLDVITSWVKAGYPLGNHTYSHADLNTTNLSDYEIEITKGAVISKKLTTDAGMQYKYFRYPYLHTGKTPEIRYSIESFLKKEGYIIAPVTIDTDDWVFNRELMSHPGDKEEIINAYLAHTKKKFEFYKYASVTMFERNISHIWVLHVNLLNSYVMSDLLKIAKEEGYDFISLDEALKDQAYKEPDKYYNEFGISYLYRWDYTRGKVVDWSKDPEPDLN